MKPSYNRVNRQKSAAARKERYDKLTTQQKLEVLNRTEPEPKAAHQRARLMGRIAKENLAIVAKAVAKAEKKK